MCKFNYHRYDECGHRVIKLDHFCAPKFWMSGIKGALVSCEEKLYTSLAVMNDVVFVGRWRWYGMKGWCLNCEREFLTHTTPLPIRSYNDEIFTLTSFLSDTWTEPFIHLPAIHKSVPELLGLAHEFRIMNENSPLDEGPECHFPEKFEVYIRDPEFNRIQWIRKSTGFYEPPHKVQTELRNMLGFCMADIAKIGKAIKNNWKGSEIYAKAFKARGMTKQAFDEVTDRVYNQYLELNPQLKPATRKGTAKGIKWKS